MAIEGKPSTEAEQRVKEIQALHHKVREKIKKSNAGYQVQANKHRKKVVFQPGDLVLVHLRKERCPQKRKSKLSSRVDGPFEVLERINDNACKVELPSDYGVSTTFNVTDLSPYLDDVLLEDLRENPLQQREADEDPSTEASSSRKVQAMVIKVMQQGPNQTSLPSLFN